MKQVVLFIFLIVLGSCQKPQGTVTHDFDQYLAGFNSDLARLGYSQIDFSQTMITSVDGLNENGAARLGMCYSVALRNGGPVNIGVSPLLSQNGPDVIRAMIYHELGHCFLGLDHVSTHSIMNGGNTRTLFTFDEMNDENKRLVFVKEMLEASGYR